MSETSKKIIKEIHEWNIKHIPKWRFLIKNISVWASLILAVILGALSISIEESVLEKGIGTSGFLNSDFFRLLFHGFSALWILCTLLFVILAFLNLRLTEEGYRYRTWWIILGILLVIATFGLVFNREGIGDRAESAAEHTSFYQNVLSP
jgi:hypothetical protein